MREGKESSQGVAYLDDGTVVVDGARRPINRRVDIIVTSVHQTPARKMIFGRLDERSEASTAKANWSSGSSIDALPAENGDGHARPEAPQRAEAGSRAAFPDTDRP